MDHPVGNRKEPAGTQGVPDRLRPGADRRLSRLHLPVRGEEPLHLAHRPLQGDKPQLRGGRRQDRRQGGHQVQQETVFRHEAVVPPGPAPHRPHQHGAGGGDRGGRRGSGEPQEVGNRRDLQQVPLRQGEGGCPGQMGAAFA